MNGSRSRQALTLAAIAMIGISLMGCGANAPAASSQSAESTESSEVAAPADLAGEWVQTNSESEDSYQSAAITADAIEVSWVSDGGSTKALYWAGTYEAPTEPGAFTWDSLNATEKTSGAMLASDDATKTFSYDNDVISYEVTALGVTKTVELRRE
jgi:hypothetical protein